MTNVQQTSDDEQPWEQPGAFRRDCEPHRVRFLRALGDFSAALALPTICTGIGTPLGLVLGIVVWLMAAHDLARMQKKLMDPTGASDTIIARNCGIATVILTGSICAFWVCALMLIR